MGLLVKSQSDKRSKNVLADGTIFGMKYKWFDFRAYANCSHNKQNFSFHNLPVFVF